MEQVIKPKNYKKLLKNVINSFLPTQKIIVQPIYMGIHESEDSVEKLHFFFSVTEYDKEFELWVDARYINGDYFKSESYNLDNKFISILLKGLQTKEFKTFKVLFGDK